ncbi:MAG: hypothetical protein KBE73_04200 [Fusobacteriaceae bacterium]|nr:hypothetical protein [Fusobacteriaceae bacterium]MBP9510320.1 hypothetical protein [Fusobacteriaceae bacterium]
MLKKILVFSMFIFTVSFANTATTPNSEDAISPIIGKEVTGVNLQQLEYKQIVNTNELLKNQRIESTNMEIVGDSIKKQRQRIKVVQSDEVQLQKEVVKGKKTGFFGSLFE